MHMGPIVAAETTRRAAPSTLARRVTGTAVLLVATPVMAVWLTANAIVACVVLGGGALLSAVDYTGRVALRD